MEMKLQGVLVVFYLMFPANIIGLWWAVGSPLLMDPNSICRKTKRLAGKQREICKNEPEIVREVAKGAEEAIGECQHQFKNRRWNCTSHRRSIGKILQKDTREAAFVYAITASGVMFSVTNACSKGGLLQCSCVSHYSKETAPDTEFSWGGCHDNIAYGYQKCKEFMDAMPKRRRGDIRTLIQLHNNEAGRLAVSNSMVRKCKCHGLSGSCELKTCWHKMAPFQSIGIKLKKRFDGASKVMGSNDGKRLLPEGDTIKPPSKRDLIYAERSQNFCRPNRRAGSLGTSGRVCDPKSPGVGGCDILCCGRGYRKYQKTVSENCRCRFKWCCSVICETCIVPKTIYKCV